MKKLIPLFLILVGGASAFACGSDGNGSPSAACVPKSYQADVSSACLSCVQSKCATEYKALCDANCNSGSAGNGALSQACSDAFEDVSPCAATNCPVCKEGNGSAGSGNGSAGSGSGSAGAPASGGSGRACTISSGASFAVCTHYSQLTPAQVASSCTQGGGTPSEHCSSTNLAGCCTVSGTAICYYNAAITEQVCTQSGGTWSKTAP